MNKTLISAVAALLAFASVADEAEDALPVVPTNAAPKVFTALPLCRRVEGRAEVRKPGGDWQPAEEGKFYPLGTSYRVPAGGMLAVAFGSTSTVTIRDGAEFGTRLQPVGGTSRTIVLVRGTVSLKLPSNLPDGAFFAAAPGFTVKNPAGEAQLAYSDLGDGDEATIRCVTGTLGVEGRHFDIPTMHAAHELKVRTSRDHLSTILTGRSGDYAVKVDQGIRARDEFDDDGNRKTVEEPAVLDWHLTPMTKVVINRSVPAIGERMSVHTMAFDASGALKSECSFCEGRSEINSGEIVPAEQTSPEELAKKAAEMTEEQAVEDEGAEEESSDEETSDSEDSDEEDSEEEE